MSLARRHVRDQRRRRPHDGGALLQRLVRRPRVPDRLSRGEPAARAAHRHDAAGADRGDRDVAGAGRAERQARRARPARGDDRPRGAQSAGGHALGRTDAHRDAAGGRRRGAPRERLHHRRDRPAGERREFDPRLCPAPPIDDARRRGGRAPRPRPAALARRSRGPRGSTSSAPRRRRFRRCMPIPT